jgi:hypothetical protein
VPPSLISEQDKELSVQDYQTLDKQPAFWKFSARGPHWKGMSFKRRLAIGLGILFILAVVGIIVGVIVGRERKDRNHSTCPGNTTGAACTLG